MPFSVHHNVDHPLSLYAATKKANELMAHAYSHLYRLPTTGLRFFTVYGPWGRPDMAVSSSRRPSWRAGRSTFSTTATCGATSPTSTTSSRAWSACSPRLPQPDPQWSGDRPDPGTSAAPYRIYNIGNNRPVELLQLIEVLETCLGRKAVKNLLPMQPGDVPETFADIDDLVARRRLPAEHAHRGGHRPLRPMVSRLPQVRSIVSGTLSVAPNRLRRSRRGPCR